MSILSVMADVPRHHELRSLTQIGDIQVVDVPCGPASFLILCDDGCILAIRCMGQSELLQVIRQHSLDAIMLRLREQSPWAYLLIDVLEPDHRGEMVNGSGWRWDAVQGALLSAQEFGVGIVQIPTPNALAATIEQLASRNREAKRIRPPRDALWLSPAEDLLLALPGIGEQKADALLKQCNTAAWALTALTMPGSFVPGIGPTIRASVKQALGLKSDEWLCVTTPLMAECAMCGTQQPCYDDGETWICTDQDTCKKRQIKRQAA